MQSGMQVIDLSHLSGQCPPGGELEFLMAMESYRDLAESDPITELDRRQSAVIQMEGWAVRAHEEAMTMEDGHPKRREKLLLSQALRVYAAAM